MLHFIKGVASGALPSKVGNEGLPFYDILVIDISGSMYEEAFVSGETKLETMDKAVRALVRQKKESRPYDYLALIAYHTFATRCCGLLNVGTDHHGIVRAMDGVQSLDSGGTQIYTGLEEASKIVDTIPEQAHCQPRILAYSDGCDRSERKAIRIADRLRKLGVIIETFGVAASPSEIDSFLKKLATTDSNGFVHYRFLGDAETINETFKEIALGTLTVD
ncbi:VWA domain-containing protein [bacterium AH-315-P07]|nr:VWA domain-containing protein [bacterium AH-315-P07]